MQLMQICWETGHKIGTCPLNVNKEVCSGKCGRLKQTMGHEDNMRMGIEATDHSIDSYSYRRMPSLPNMFSYPYGMLWSIHGMTYQPHVGSGSYENTHVDPRWYEHVSGTNFSYRMGPEQSSQHSNRM